MSATVRPGPALWIAAVVGPIAYGLLSVVMGQDNNWDLLNYHFYNPYAFLHGRMGFDIAPANAAASYFNPLQHLPFYAFVTTLPPRGTGFAMGLLQGLNFPLLLAIAWQVLSGVSATARRAATIALAGVGMLGGMTLGELGTTFQDNVISLFALGALAIVLLFHRRLLDAPLLTAVGVAAAAGLVAGLGVGLKPTNVIFAIGWCAAFWFLATAWRRRFFLSFGFGLGVLAGIATTGAYWMWVLWRHFGNPLFPFYNQIFRSPWAVDADYADLKFRPESWLEAVLFPLRFAFDPLRTAEEPFRELRLTLLYGLAILTLLAWPLVRRRASTATPLTDRATAPFVLGGCLIAYAVWLATSGIYRYVVTLEMLAPVLMLLVVDRLALPHRVQVGIVAALLAVSLATMRPASWGRTSWGDDFFGVTVPAIADPRRSMVLMAGLEPTAYVVPFFPPEIPFLRIQGWFTGSPTHPTRHDEVMRRRVAAHEGPLFILYREPIERVMAVDALAAYGLIVRDTGCTAMRPRIDRWPEQWLAFCPVDRR
ncbi:MAG TPA: hypothetical protein VJ890_17265 [Vineibacter sp.]|nr:hypothetical protein [Vineibacter sp.]